MIRGVSCSPRRRARQAERPVFPAFQASARKNFPAGTNHKVRRIVWRMSRSINRQEARTRLQDAPLLTPRRRDPMSADTRDEVVPVGPCMIIAHEDPLHAAQLERSFRRQGWDVYLARCGPAARRLARLLTPDVVILAVELPEESGWLTCEKLTHELPLTKVFLIGDPRQPRSEDFATFVGAAALMRRDALAPHVEEVVGRTLHAAG